MTSVLAERVLYETKPSGCPAYRVSAFELEGVRRVVVRCWERPASEGRHESQADSLNLRESSIAGLLDALEKAAP